MNLFDILELNDKKYKMLIVLKVPEAPLKYLDELSNLLIEKHVRGYVLIDELMHSGNSEDRFILAYFDGKKFDDSSFKFEQIDRRSEVRKLSCDLLRSEPMVIEYSTLSNVQKKLINKGVYI